MSEIFKLLLFLAVWIVIMKIVLPRRGVPTGMSGTCNTGDRYKDNETEDKKDSGGE